MDLGLKGKKAAITGSSQGIGYAIAAALADEGCDVALSARGKEALERAVADMADKDVYAMGHAADLSAEEGCKSFIAAAAEGLGGLDILINNVGGMIPGSWDSMDDEAWHKALGVNLLATVFCTKYAVPHIRKSSAGRILNVTGVSGRQLLPGSFTTTVPNAGITGFTKLMAAELGPEGITVNNICPGFTAVQSWGPRAEEIAEKRGITPDEVRDEAAGQTFLKRWADPSEIGDAAAFMVSARNSYMTGITVEVCGGFTRYI